MGIDRHEWEHRNYKPGQRTPARESDDPAPPGAENIPLQPMMTSNVTAGKESAKAPEEEKTSAKPPAKNPASRSPPKRPARARE